MRSKSFLFLAIYLLISSLILLSAWPSNKTSLVVQGEVSRELFSLFAVSQTFVLVLLIPAVLGPSLAVEKERETIGLLNTTPLSAGKILLGKLLSGLFFFLLLSIVSIPLLLLCFVIGGIGVEDVMGMFVFFLVQIFHSDLAGFPERHHPIAVQAASGIHAYRKGCNLCEFSPSAGKKIADRNFYRRLFFPVPVKS